MTPETRFCKAPFRLLKSDRQTLATLGTSGVYNGAAATSLHANQETVCACAANLGRLVSAFHVESPNRLNGSLRAGNPAERQSSLPNKARVTGDYRKFSEHRQQRRHNADFLLACAGGTGNGGFDFVDKALINYNSQRSN